MNRILRVLNDDPSLPARTRFLWVLWVRNLGLPMAMLAAVFMGVQVPPRLLLTPKVVGIVGLTTVLSLTLAYLFGWASWLLGLNKYFREPRS
jgi:hypothetical protein